jgi:hypothetical protein
VRRSAAAGCKNSKRWVTNNGFASASVATDAEVSALRGKAATGE